MLAGSLFLLPLSYFFEIWSVSFNLTFLFTFLYIAAFPGIIGPVICLFAKRDWGCEVFFFPLLVPFFGLEFLIFF